MNSSKHLKRYFFIISILSFVFISAQTDPPAYRLIIFEGSDWCAQCIRLEEEVLSDTAFINFANRHEIQLERIDFPQRKKLDKDLQRYNESVAEQYKFNGSFPTLLLVNSNSGAIFKVNYSDQTPKEFIFLIHSKITIAQ